jgi:hypothetical protein
MKLTNHLHLVPTLRMCGFMPSLPHKSSRRGAQLIMRWGEFSLHSKLYDLFNLQCKDEIKKRNVIGFSMDLTCRWYSFDVSQKDCHRISACGVVKVFLCFMQTNSIVKKC